jgi:hypothetical protein
MKAFFEKTMQSIQEGIQFIDMDGCHIFIQEALKPHFPRRDNKTTDIFERLGIKRTVKQHIRRRMFNNFPAYGKVFNFTSFIQQIAVIHRCFQFLGCSAEGRDYWQRQAVTKSGPAYQSANRRKTDAPSQYLAGFRYLCYFFSNIELISIKRFRR